ncbi:aldo/keto reductase [Ktedonobacter sp. SOSP1-52]|uniref:aldo/keto reductase n=1 Tax=Ktedonobacter sp. SOSP1-52 TaxID=2778366 RepID=UPI001915D233|nr:aldo/keto reductase [Ktedonobacter sp. SOSP1-52]GHO65088.1 aldo/keto reductase [Ktedonobacter sp. SOSP1-52]
MLQQQRQTPLYLRHTQLSLSRVGVGTWAIGGGWGPQPEAQSLQALHEALEQGCLLIDTAALYGNGRAEKIVAQAFRESQKRVTTLTKIYPLHYHWSPSAGTPMRDIYPPEHIIAQAEASLRRLETDCLDCLLFQTWCPSWGKEREWYDTMCLLQAQGKIRAFGISVSDHRPDDANDVIEAGLVDIIEVSYSILDQRAAEQLFPLAQQHNISVIARSPLASGALTGTWHEGMKFHRQDWRRRVFRGELWRQTLQRVAHLQDRLDTSLPLAQIALRFCLSHPAITAVIPGIRAVEQARCNLAVLHQEPLSQEALAIISALWKEEFRYHVRVSIGEEGEG